MGPLLHVVFARLKDPLDTASFVDACNHLARSVPTVRGVHVGLHEEIGRQNIVRDYDVCFVTAFDSVDGYRAYLDHPEHLRLLDAWRERIESLRISDSRDVAE